MERFYLAVDIGASGGRHILGSIQQGRLTLEEVYRFENSMKKTGDGHLCWDHKKLFEDIKTGLKKCKEIGKIPVSMGIDTWGVDYALLDAQDQLIDRIYGYRDSRTAGMDQEVYKILSERDLYARTGIQKKLFNTIYQLMADRVYHPERLEKAKTLLFVPDYFNFLLTGRKVCEYTEATTSQLIRTETKNWDYELMEMLDYKKEIFPEIVAPGARLGRLKPELVQEIGYDLEVIAPCEHDTESAILAVPANDRDFVYISSGTWSLLGIERPTADCSELSRVHHFTNEGGYDGQYCYLRNIMGLWMIQSVRRELNYRYSFSQLCEEAANHKAFPSRVNVNDDCFMAPEHMITAIQEYCSRTGQPIPENAGELAAVCYGSLAECYGQSIRELEIFTGRTYGRIHIVGGGSNANYLNELTANITGKEVYAGPDEATAVGNLALQMLHAGELVSKKQIRELVYQSFSTIQCFRPDESFLRQGIR